MLENGQEISAPTDDLEASFGVMLWGDPFRTYGHFGQPSFQQAGFWAELLSLEPKAPNTEPPLRSTAARP
jgi:hypothetical protein